MAGRCRSGRRFNSEHDVRGRHYVDSTVLSALGRRDRLSLLATLPETPVVLPAIREEVTTEPAARNVETFCDRHDARAETPPDRFRREAVDLLGDDTPGDVALVAAVLREDDPPTVLTDDRRLRNVCDGLGARVSGTLGVIVSAVESGLDPEEARELLRDLSGGGFHMTAELYERTRELIDEAAMGER